jgi:acyl carrier protein phosphodiesterase
MNFLAHLLCSHGNKDVMVGNFLGDFVIRSDYTRFSESIRRGFELHHFIDTFTDSHPLVRSFSSMFKEEFKRYSTVISDVVYDHYVARDWNLYSPISLEKFAEDSYTSLYEYYDILPTQVQRFLPYMRADNWLVQYREIEGIERALKGMSRRANFNKELHLAIGTIQQFDTQLQKNAREYIPILLNATSEYLGKY